MTDEVDSVTMRRISTKASVSEDGMALVAALLVTAILTTLVTDFIYGSYIASSRASVLRGSSRAGALAADGVVLAKSGLEAMLKKDANIVIDRDGLVFSRPAGQGLSIEVRVVDEAGKLSLRTVYPMTGFPDPKADGALRKLLGEQKLDGRLADSLADWIDGDDVTRPGGAEAAQYAGRKRPVKPRNNHLETVDELMLVNGFSAEVFSAVGSHVTVYSKDGLVNINTAPREVLSALSDEMTAGLADEIIKKRKQAPFRDRSELMKVRGFERAGFSLQDRVTTTSRTFRVFSRARADETVREVEAVIELGGGILYWRES